MTRADIRVAMGLMRLIVWLCVFGLFLNAVLWFAVGGWAHIERMLVALTLGTVMELLHGWTENRLNKVGQR